MYACGMSQEVCKKCLFPFVFPGQADASVLPTLLIDEAETVIPVKQILQRNRGKRNPHTTLLGLRHIPHQPGTKYAACCH